MQVVVQVLDKSNYFSWCSQLRDLWARDNVVVTSATSLEAYVAELTMLECAIIVQMVSLFGCHRFGIGPVLAIYKGSWACHFRTVV